MRDFRREAGFTLVELLVAISILASVSGGLYAVMLSGSRSSDRTQSVAQVSQEARLGFNRLVRDTREALILEAPVPTSFKVKVDFDGDGSYDNPNVFGDYEDLMFTYNPSAKTITLGAGAGGEEILMGGVEKIDAATDIFSYASNRLEYDIDANGITTYAELQATPTLTPTERVNYLSSVVFNLKVRRGGTSTNFYAEAQLRNRR